MKEEGQKMTNSTNTQMNQSDILGVLKAQDMFEAGVLSAYTTRYTFTRKDEEATKKYGQKMYVLSESPTMRVAELMKKYPYRIFVDRNQIVFAQTQEILDTYINEVYESKEVTEEEREEFFKSRHVRWKGYTVHTIKKGAAYPYETEFFNYLNEQIEMKRTTPVDKVTHIYYYGFSIPILRRDTQSEYLEEIERIDSYLKLPDKYKEPNVRRNNIYEQIIEDYKLTRRNNINSLTALFRGIIPCLAHHGQLFAREVSKLDLKREQYNSEYKIYFKSEEARDEALQLPDYAQLMKYVFMQQFNSERAYEQQKEILMYKALFGTYPAKTVKLEIFGLSVYLYKQDALDILYTEMLPHYKDVPFSIDANKIILNFNYKETFNDTEEFQSVVRQLWLTPEEWEYLKVNDLPLPKRREY